MTVNTAWRRPEASPNKQPVQLMTASEKREMAKRSNRRWVSLAHPEAFEADSPISPHRADAHHGQESQNSTNRSDIRSQSYLVANRSIRSCKPGDWALISLTNTLARRGSPNNRRAECDELSTAARPPASVRGALPGRRPWITLRPHADPPAFRLNQGSPRSRTVWFQCRVSRICVPHACLPGGVHIRMQPARCRWPSRRRFRAESGECGTELVGSVAIPDSARPCPA